jgi:DNA-binding IclR family transcriptional regulator
VTALDSDFKQENWIIRALTPRLERLSEEILWPVSLEMIQGQQLTIRATVHALSPLTNERCPVGTRLALDGSAAGLLHVAHGYRRSTETIGTEIGRNSESKVVRAAVRRRGYATYLRPGPGMSELAVPIYVQKNLIATLTARYFPSVLSDRHGTKKLADRLRDAAQEIAAIIPSHVVAAVPSQGNESATTTSAHSRKRGNSKKQR